VPSRGKQVSFTDLLISELMKVHREEPQLYDADEQRAVYMGWRRDDEHKWALIGPVACVRETAKALLVKFERAEEWVPKFMLHEDENEIEHEGDIGILVIPEWLAKEKGWL